MNYITNMQTALNVDDDLINYIDNIINFVISNEISTNTEISVLLVDNEEIRKLNSKYRNIDNCTDVLSFPQIDYEDGKTFNELYKNYEFPLDYYNDDCLVLGDIVISLEKIKTQSTEYLNTFEEELRYMVVHSIFHLLGYDHIKEEDKIVMRKKEKEMLEKLNNL